MLETMADELLPKVGAFFLQELHSLTVIILNLLLSFCLIQCGNGLLRVDLQFLLYWGLREF